MTREIYIVNPEHLKVHILYNGPKNDDRRREYLSLDILLQDVSNFDIKPTKKLLIHLEGYNSEQVKSIKSFLSAKIPKAEYIIDETLG